MEKVKKSGTIRALRKDKKGFTLTDDPEKWYSSFDAADNISKGNEVEFNVITVTKNDRTYHNFYDLKVTKAQSAEASNDRLNIDAGNCLSAEST